MLVDPALSGLPAFLTPKPGLNSGFMIPQVTAAALVSENKQRAYPASVDSIPTSANQEDHVSMAAHGARRLTEHGGERRRGAGHRAAGRRTGLRLPRAAHLQRRRSRRCARCSGPKCLRWPTIGICPPTCESRSRWSARQRCSTRSGRCRGSLPEVAARRAERQPADPRLPARGVEIPGERLEASARPGARSACRLAARRALRAARRRDFDLDGDLAHRDRLQPRPVRRFTLSGPGDDRPLPDRDVRRRAALQGRGAAEIETRQAPFSPPTMPHRAEIERLRAQSIPALSSTTATRSASRAASVRGCAAPV